MARFKIHPQGRPSKYTEEIAEEICAKLASGTSLRDICQSEDMPEERTVRGWAMDDVCGFFPRYARARDIGLDCENERILEIAKDGSRDYIEIRDDDGNLVERRVDHENIQRSRLIVDTMKWRLSKMAPKKYGDKLTLAGDANNPITISIAEVLRQREQLAGSAPLTIDVDSTQPVKRLT